jgi:hypothetical protein
MADAHTHPGLEDRITAEIVGMHTDLVELRRETRHGFADLRAEISRGFTEVAQVLGQILARLPDAGDGNGPAP